MRRKALIVLALVACLATLLPIALPARSNISSANQFAIVFPVVAPHITSNFGSRFHPIFKITRNHSGIDLAAPLNSMVRAIAAGQVIFADTNGGYGKMVSVQHKNGYISVYGHLRDILVNPGEKVKAGQLLGHLGSSGDSTGPHLHFEWRKNGKPLDPISFFPALAAQAEG